MLCRTGRMHTKFEDKEVIKMNNRHNNDMKNMKSFNSILITSADIQR